MQLFHIRSGARFPAKSKSRKLNLPKIMRKIQKVRDFRNPIWSPFLHQLNLELRRNFYDFKNFRKTHRICHIIEEVSSKHSNDGLDNIIKIKSWNHQISEILINFEAQSILDLLRDTFVNIIVSRKSNLSLLRLL